MMSAVETTRHSIPPTIFIILIMPQCKDFASVFGVSLPPFIALLRLFMSLNVCEHQAYRPFARGRGLEAKLDDCRSAYGYP